MCSEGADAVYKFHSQPLWNVFNMLNVNVNTQTILTHHMVESWNNQDHPKAAVITYSSLAALSPQQILPVYGATKKYALEFTRNLARQYPWIDFEVVNARHTPDAHSHAQSVIGRIGTSNHLFSQKNLLITQGSVFQQLQGYFHESIIIKQINHFLHRRVERKIIHQTK